MQRQLLRHIRRLQDPVPDASLRGKCKRRLSAFLRGQQDIENCLIAWGTGEALHAS